MRHRERSLLLCGAVAALSTAVAGIADGSRPERLLVPWLVAHAAYLAAAWLILRRQARARLALLLAIGLLPRLWLLPGEPKLSEDVYRYLWDGRLVAAGVNPFPHPPDDPALSRYHDALLGRLNHAEVPTIYPPMAQALFGAAARTAVKPWAWKGVLLVLEGILLLGLVRLLERRGLAPERFVLYFWNPLVVLESFGSGHVDLAAAAFLVLALALLEVRRPILGGAAFAAAALVKYLPLLLVPALLRRRAYVALGAAGAAGILLFLPFLSAGGALWTGLTTYLRHWEFNGSLYALLRPGFATGETPRLVLAACLAAASFAIARRTRTLSGAALALLAAWLLASPTVYPWYLVLPIALLPLHPEPGFLLFSGLVALSYLPLPLLRETGAWALPAWIPLVEYGGWGAASALAAGVRRYRRAAACATESTPT